MPNTPDTLSALALITSSQSFHDSEQRIVDFILANTETAPQMTSAQLARASKTSEASVSRFCKRLGFSNFRAFQFSLARDLVARSGDEQVTREVSLDEFEQSIANIKNAKVREIESTLDALDPETLHTIVDLFAHADLVMFAAVGNTNAVAIDAAIKFGQLGIRSVANTITESSTSLALTMREGDVLVLISNSGKSQRLERILRAAKQSGATVILICGNTNAPLARLSDIVLRTVNYEALLTTVDFTFSKISATLIIEVIYSFLLPHIPGARDSISRYEELIQGDKEVE
ncbi:MAG: MurR/RpiR family transcriptional regulator [Coriobacteriaceae bacterium]|nr:MurR/RpiR family transcriptional regulator [Coriobacteriaceae bacterium]